MTLGEQQRLFVQLIGRLIGWAYENGLELTFGEAFRTSEQAALNAAKGSGITNSLHTDRLAIDMNLFVNGEYKADTQSYRGLGEHWETLHPLCRWGGRFTKADGNHFSVAFGGRA